MQALHSSSFGTSGGVNIYLGNPLGLVLHFPDDKTLYHMGDTDIFSDMALINELHEPKIGIVPIGDRFTMGGAVAALACRRFFKFETVVPCHYATFGLIDQTPDKFVAGMEGSGVEGGAPKSARRRAVGTGRRTDGTRSYLATLPSRSLRPASGSRHFIRASI